jgi:excisionase family DNA binding protein
LLKCTALNVIGDVRSYAINYGFLCSLVKSTKVLYNPDKRYKNMEKLMTVADVAEYLRLNREVVLRKARKGEIPAVRVGTKTYRFYKEQVDEWLRSKSTVKPEALAYPLVGKGCKSKKHLSSVIKEITTKAEAEKAATSNKERQLLVLKQAAALRAKIERRVGKTLPDSAEEIRALREERAHRGP